jgi:hypothetical protein
LEKPNQILQRCHLLSCENPNCIDLGAMRPYFLASIVKEPVHLSYSLEPGAEFVDEMFVSVCTVDGLTWRKRYLESKRAFVRIPTVEHGKTTPQLTPD